MNDGAVAVVVTTVSVATMPVASVLVTAVMMMLRHENLLREKPRPPRASSRGGQSVMLHAIPACRRGIERRG